MSTTATLSKQKAGTEYEINKTVQEKSVLLDLLQGETKRWELKKLSLEHDIADLELCEIMMRYSHTLTDRGSAMILFFLKGKTT